MAFDEPEDVEGSDRRERTMRVSLTVLIDYDTSDYEDDAIALTDIQTLLHTSVTRMVGEGGLSGVNGETKAFVDTYEVHTDRVEE